MSNKSWMSNLVIPRSAMSKTFSRREERFPFLLPSSLLAYSYLGLRSPGIKLFHSFTSPLENETSILPSGVKSESEIEVTPYVLSLMRPSILVEIKPSGSLNRPRFVAPRITEPKLVPTAQFEPFPL